MIDKTIAHYTIIEKLGGGGMGVVYRAEDTKLHRPVALKFLPPELTFDEEARQRFIHEAQAASALDHPNICSIYEINETPDGLSYIAMGCYDGETLKQRIGRGPISLEDTLSVVIQIAEGLARAHEAGIVHRDIKPANIMITDRGEVKILDFGLAKLRGMTRVTRTGTTVGTAAYMSPEQARGDDVDPRSDVWSLGVVLYEMLSGQLPFKSEYEQGLAYLILNEKPDPIRKHVPEIDPDLAGIVERAMEKKPESRYATAAEMLTELKSFRESLRPELQSGFNIKVMARRLKRPVIAVPTLLALLALVAGAVWFFDRQAKIRWAREVALPEIERQVAANDFWRNLIPPYKLAVQAEEYIPDDPELKELFTKCSHPINIRTEPPGASVYVKDNNTPESAWEYVGVTPLEKHRMPISVLRWMITKEGYDTVLAAMSTWTIVETSGTAMPLPYDFFRTLDKNGSIPAGMTRIGGITTEAGRMTDFFLDRYEVTNADYKKFVDAGGYQNRKYWNHPFILEGKELTWEDGIGRLVDQTGQRGPSTWQGGDYLEGQDRYPVSGISWYEAAAYAEYAGKVLPTIHHWGAAEGDNTPFKIFDNYTRNSNFSGRGPSPVGSFNGMTPYGTFDLGGNVREWCWNETPRGRSFRGGAWDDNVYMACVPSQTPPFDRSSRNGVRCAVYPDRDKLDVALFQNAADPTPPDLSTAVPVSGAVFNAYREQFAYDRSPLNARIESRRDNAEGWTWERIVLDAPYGEQIIANLFLPKNAAPPYQTVIYFPGAGSMAHNSSADIEHYYEFPMFLSFLLKNGRAVLYPVYKGTFERLDPSLFPIMLTESRRNTEWEIEIVQDFRRCVDYLVTRKDIDTGKLAYYGMSWGAHFGAIIPAVEPRLKASVLLGGGLMLGGRPEVNPVNYVGRVTIPTLMLNGKYDLYNPPQIYQKPMFDRLGTPPADKRWILYDTDHFIERNEYIRETLTWFDRYLGKVK